MVNAKRKGGSGEREVVGILKSMTGCEHWYRVPGSGNCATGNMKLVGDVYSTDAKYLGLVIEVKNHTGFVTLNDLINKKSKFHSWCEQTKIDCINSQREGYLFFKSGGKWFWHRIRLSGMSFQPSFFQLLKSVSLMASAGEFGMIDRSALFDEEVIVPGVSVDG